MIAVWLLKVPNEIPSFRIMEIWIKPPWLYVLIGDCIAQACIGQEQTTTTNIAIKKNIKRYKLFFLLKLNIRYCLAFENDFVVFLLFVIITNSNNNYIFILIIKI